MRGILLSLLVIGLVGCTSTPTTSGEKDKGKGVIHSSGHVHGPGPHEGTVFDLGKYHAEFKPDHTKKEVTIWILGDDEKTPEPVDADKLEVTIAEFKAKDKTVPSFTFDLKAMPEKDDPMGKSSRFVGTHDNIAIEAEYKGTVSARFDGKPATGKFAESPPKK